MGMGKKIGNFLGAKEVEALLKKLTCDVLFQIQLNRIHVIGKSVLQSERHSSTHGKSGMGGKFCFFVRVS